MLHVVPACPQSFWSILSGLALMAPCLDTGWSRRSLSDSNNLISRNPPSRSAALVAPLCTTSSSCIVASQLTLEGEKDPFPFTFEVRFPHCTSWEQKRPEKQGSCWGSIWGSCWARVALPAEKDKGRDTSERFLIKAWGGTQGTLGGPDPVPYWVPRFYKPTMHQWDIFYIQCLVKRKRAF